jgi:hypothetical protein
MSGYVRIPNEYVHFVSYLASMAGNTSDGNSGDTNGARTILMGGGGGGGGNTGLGSLGGGGGGVSGRWI